MKHHKFFLQTHYYHCRPSHKIPAFSARKAMRYDIDGHLPLFLHGITTEGMPRVPTSVSVDPPALTTAMSARLKSSEASHIFGSRYIFSADLFDIFCNCRNYERPVPELPPLKLFHV